MSSRRDLPRAARHRALGATLAAAAVGACVARLTAPTEARVPNVAAAAASGRPISATASYGDQFPKLDDLAARLPSQGKPLDWSNPQKLYLLADLGAYIDASSLPFLAALVRGFPQLTVIVLDRFEDRATRAWLERSPFVCVPWTVDVYQRLERASADPRFGDQVRHLTTPWPSMAAADGVAREPVEAAVFHGGWLIWIGAVANTEPVIRAASKGRWSHQSYVAYEGVRDQLDGYATLVMQKRFGEAHQIAARMLAQAEVQPTRLLDLSHAMALSLQDREDVNLARALAYRAARETAFLDFDVMLNVLLTSTLTADNAGAVAAARRALELCRSVQTGCDREVENLEKSQRCPKELVTLAEFVHAPLPLPRDLSTSLPQLVARTRQDAPPGCDPLESQAKP